MGEAGAGVRPFLGRHWRHDALGLVGPGRLVTDALQLVLPRLLGTSADELAAGRLTPRGILRIVALLGGVVLGVGVGPPAAGGR